MIKPSTILPPLVASVGVLAAATLIYTLAREELTWALPPFLILCACAVVTPHVLQDR